MNQEEKKMKVDISSSMVEKGIDMAKNFVDSLIMPAIEETGLLIKDKVTSWRFNNQIKMLNKAKKSCEENQINPKTISLKLLCPLLDYASLEEEEYLQDKWAFMLSNMVDSEQNIDNHVFPYLLSQISISELQFLEQAILKKNETIEILTIQLALCKKNNTMALFQMEEKEKQIQKEFTKVKEENIRGNSYINTSHYLQSIHDLNQKIHHLKYRDKQESEIQSKIYREQFLSVNDVKEYEIANMVRLGLIKAIQIPYATAKSLKIPNDPDARYLTADIEIEIEADYEDYTLTELGNLFVFACNEKGNKNQTI